MKIEFNLTLNDYRKTLIELISKKIQKLFLFIFIFSIISIIYWANTGISLFTIILLSILSPAFITVVLLGKDLFAFFKVIKQIKQNPSTIGDISVVIEEGYMQVEKDGITTFQWTSFKRIEILSTYIVLIFQNKSFFIINTKALDPQTSNKFIIFLAQKSKLTPNYSPTEINKKTYWFGLLGLIPNVGLIVGLILLFKGLQKANKILIIIGIAAISFTPTFWFLFQTYSKSYQKTTIEATQQTLNSVVKELENYKINNGYYPDSLEALKKQNRLIYLYDSFAKPKFIGKSSASKLYYQKNVQGYVLKSLGPDKIPDTRDDIYPTITHRKE